ncbi:hypothetical protein I656_00780 [Geobacillus sp. WSUCF1]|nr:hypothetical protein I656_00780 [Geobacillus sp. WSUCF1]
MMELLSATHIASTLGLPPLMSRTSIRIPFFMPNQNPGSSPKGALGFFKTCHISFSKEKSANP